MARKIPALTPNYDGAVSGYPEGSFRDNPGDLTGSGVVSGWGNDLHYGQGAVIYKYKGDKSGNPETTTASDFLDAVEIAIEAAVPSVSAWNVGTDYSTLGNVSVMRYGIQFTSILSSGNLGKDPMTNPTYWLPVPTARELFADHVHGRVIMGGSLSLHDHTNANYKQYFSLGTHKLGGASGYAFNAHGVHLDGSGVGSGALSAIVEAWHLKDSFAPGSTGSRTLKDAKGRLLRAIDASGGRADLIGEVLDDQFQGHGFNLDGLLGAASAGGTVARYPVSSDVTNKTFVGTSAAVINRVSNGTDGTPRTGTVTADKSITVGVPYMVICVPA